MCGICGIYNINGSKLQNKDILDKMLTAIKHRGPDGSWTLLHGRAALGFNRLSFIDLDGGAQPIQNEDKTISMICNGEIFNYQDLRRELLAKGHCFRTKTDVEVILHLYEEYGTDFVTRLNGQFAIALYDDRNQSMLLVRDHVGICPLFYTIQGEQIIFASEIKAILEYPGIERRLNLKAVDQLMNFPGVVSPNTFFAGIYSVRPGHMLLVDHAATDQVYGTTGVNFGHDNRVRDIEYWDIEFTEEEDKGEAYYTERLRELLHNAISRRLIADVPVGFYISGGLDSSVVACFIGKYLMNSPYSFSAEIGKGELDESRFQQMVRDCVHSKHYSTAVNEEKIWEYLEDVVYYSESGLKESYDVAAFLLSGLVASSPAKAVLTGQGSDEYFCGYVGYMVDLFRNMQKDKMTKEECEINERLWGDPYFRYERCHPQIREIHRQLYSSDVRMEMEKFSALAESPIDVNKVKGLSSQKRRSYIDNKIRLSDHLLGEHGDRMFFSHSVEGRHPFLDQELISFVLTIPDRYKLRGSREKYILKKAAEGIVPEEIIKRKKFPFQAPGMSSLIKATDRLPFLDDALLRKQNIFDVNYVNQLKQVYRQDDFKLMGAYEIDYLLIVMTVTMLCERYSLSV